MNPTEYLRHADIPAIQRPQKIVANPFCIGIACFADPGVVLLDARSLEARGHVLLDWQAARRGAARSRCLATDLAFAGEHLFVAQAFSGVLVVASPET